MMLTRWDFVQLDFFFVLLLCLLLWGAWALSWKVSFVRLQKWSAIWDFRVGASKGASVDFQKTSIVGCGESTTKVERKRKLLNWLKCPLDETAKIDELAENPSAAFGKFAWEPKSNNGHLGHCWVVIDKKCLRLNNMVRREQHCALVLAGGSCKVEFNSDSYPTAKKAVPYWWSANTPSRTRPAACT